MKLLNFLFTHLKINSHELYTIKQSIFYNLKFYEINIKLRNTGFLIQIGKFLIQIGNFLIQIVKIVSTKYN